MRIYGPRPVDRERGQSASAFKLPFVKKDADEGVDYYHESDDYQMVPDLFQGSEKVVKGAS